MHRGFFTGDERGVLELPMKMMIIAIVLAIVLAALGLSFYYYRKNRTELDLNSELTKLANDIELVHQSGDNTTRKTEMNIEIGSAVSLSYIKIGDNILPLNANNTGDAHSKWIRYKIKGETEKKIEVGVLVTNNKMDGPFTLGEGHTELRLIHRIVNSESFVIVEQFN